MSAAPAPIPSRNQFWFRAPLLLLVPAVLFLTFIAVRRSRPDDGLVLSVPASPPTNWQAAMDFSPASTSASSRPIFPYSVIPGGVRDANELQSASLKDPVVAEHYSNFRITRAHTLRLERPTLMYVSYRLDNRVYWTHRPTTIPAGETLISDGENYARVRCGNRLSPVAALPVSLSEPPAEKLNNPEWVPPLIADPLPGEGVGGFPYPANLPSLPGLPTNGLVTSGISPLGFPPILPPGVTPPGPNSSQPPPPVATPEPSLLTLLFAGTLLFGALWAFVRK